MSDYHFRVGAGGGELVQLAEGTTPALSEPGKRRLYPKSTGWYEIDSAGVERPLIAGPTAGGTDGRIAIFGGATTLKEDADFTYDTALDRLTIGVGSLTVNGKAGQENVFNESGLDQDTRIEGVAEPNLFFCDASTARIGMGTSSPASSYRLHVSIGAGSVQLNEYTAAGFSVVTNDYKMKQGVGLAANYNSWGFRWLGNNSSDAEKEAIFFLGGLSTVTAASENAFFRLLMTDGGTTRRNMMDVDLATAVTVFNEDAQNHDHRFEGQTNANLLFLDASVDGIAMGKSSVTGGMRLDVAGVIRSEGTGFGGGIFLANTTPATGRTYSVYSTDGGTWAIGDETGGVARVTMSTTLWSLKTTTGTNAVILGNAAGVETAINESALDSDTRVESQNLTHALFVDASLDVIRFGAATMSGNNVFSFEPRSGGNTLTDFRMNDGRASSSGVRMLPRKDRAGGAASAGDILFELTPLVVNSTPSEVVAASIRWIIDDATAGSEDTKIDFFNTVAGTQRNWLRMNLPGGGGAQGQVWFNPDSLDLDFKISGDTDANLFFCDASTDRIGIGTATPSDTLHISTATTALRLQRDTADATPAALRFYKARAAGAACSAGDDVINIEGYGMNATPSSVLGINIWGEILDATAGSEDFLGHLDARVAGSVRDYIRYGDVTAAGAAGGVVINELGADADTRIESDTQTHAVFVDASVDRVGFFQSVPLARVHITESTDSNEIFRLETTETNDDSVFRYFQSRIVTSNATATTIFTFALATNRKMRVTAWVIGTRTDVNPGDNGAYIRDAMFRDSGGTIAQVGATTAVSTIESNAAWDCTITFSGTNVLVQVTGVAGQTITWHATVMVQDLAS